MTEQTYKKVPINAGARNLGTSRTLLRKNVFIFQTPSLASISSSHYLHLLRPLF